MTFATSGGVPYRPSTGASLNCAAVANWRIQPVSMIPGCTPTHRTLNGPPSAAIVRVNDSSPAFAAAYGPRASTSDAYADTDPTITITPRRRSRIDGSTSTDRYHGAFRSTSTTESHWSGVRSCTSPTMLMPALFTSTSIGPNAAASSSTTALPRGRSLTSATQPCTRSAL